MAQLMCEYKIGDWLIHKRYKHLIEITMIVTWPDGKGTKYYTVLQSGPKAGIEIERGLNYRTLSREFKLAPAARVLLGTKE